MPRDDFQQFLNRMVRYIEEDGARNVRKIAMDLDIPYQTAWFRLNRLNEKGLSIVPVVDVAKLGLSRFRVTLRLSDVIQDVYSFMKALHYAAGLHYFARSLVDHGFDCEFMVPGDKKSELEHLIRSLSEMRLVHEISLHEIKWKEMFMMKTEYYDYLNGEWTVDFSHLRTNVNPSHNIESDTSFSSTDRREVDHLDLMIIRALQMNPQVKSADIAATLHRTDSDIAYHLNKHIIGTKLVPSFRLKWTGTKDAWAKHSVVMMTYVFRKISDESLRHAMAIFSSVPFTWNHLRTLDDGYHSELLIPIGYLSETMKYLSDNLRKLRITPDRIFYPDWSCYMNYTIPYFMHDAESGWNFASEKNLAQMLQVVKPFSK